MVAASVETHPAELDSIFKCQPKLTAEERAFIIRAYEYAADAHQGVTRKSGEPYIIHPLAVALILADLRLDSATLAAAMLHDVAEDTKITIADIERDFGLEVARLVDGVTKLDRLPTDTASMKGGKAGDKEAETLRKIFLAMGNDIRVVLIKLADRLHNMRTLGYLKPEAQIRMARETLDILAPLANRLGIWQIKWELEDLSFRYLHPEKYKEIAKSIAERRVDREKYLERAKAKLLRELNAQGINAQISARPKHIYSIYRKMERKRVDFNEVYDIHALRVLVDDKVSCYQVLGIVHSIWHPIPGEFDDYIGKPKDNFYQSLHTAVIDDEGKKLEVQIRTPEMHEHAEYGIAAHWRYKEGAASDPQFEERLRYLRRLMENIKDEEETAAEFVSAMQTDVFQDRVYVFTPAGDIVDLPAGATPIDFAYYIHSEVGNRCRGAKVNGVQVSLDYRLQSGERCEIITTNKRNAGPSLDWLNEDLGYVHTRRARKKIQNWFKEQDREKNIALGKDVLERELRRLGLTHFPRDQVAGLFNFSKIEDFLSAVGYGDITAGQIATKVMEVERKIQRDQAANTLSANPSTANIATSSTDAGIDIMGSSGMMINLARCCNPVRGDPIVGFITRGKGVTVHRADCGNVINSPEPDRFIKVNWGSSVEKTYPVPVIVLAYDREGLMRDVGAVIANENINMTEVDIKTRNSVATFLLTMEIENLEQLSRVLAKIEQLPNIIEARRRASG